MSFTTAQLACCVGGECYGDKTVECRGAEIDTRRSVRGKVFFALKGTKSDGHKYLNEAVAGGCSALVVENEFLAEVPVVVVSDARKALFKLAEARRGVLPAKQVIAVTGSVGKTTTKDLLSCLLGDNVTASIHSFNNDLGVPLTILDAEASEFLVTEIGANAVGEIEPLAKLVQPDIGILTSLGKAHLAGFGSSEIVKREKFRLLEAVHADGVVVVPDTIDLADSEIRATVLTVGTSLESDIQIVVSTDSRGFAELKMDGYFVTLALMGEHNAMNASLAVVAAREAMRRVGMQPCMHSLLDVASKMQSSSGRLRTCFKDDVTFIDDSYNANPTSVRSALQMFSKIKASRKILILGDMLELGDNADVEHRLLSSIILQSGADIVILVGPLMEAVSRVLCCTHEEDPSDEAIERIASLIHPNDTVLIKGSRALKLERIIQLTQQRTKVSDT